MCSSVAIFLLEPVDESCTAVTWSSPVFFVFKASIHRHQLESNPVKSRHIFIHNVDISISHYWWRVTCLPTFRRRYPSSSGHWLHLHWVDQRLILLEAVGRIRRTIFTYFSHVSNLLTFSCLNPVDVACGVVPCAPLSSSYSKLPFIAINLNQTQ